MKKYKISSGVGRNTKENFKGFWSIQRAMGLKTSDRLHYLLKLDTTFLDGHLYTLLLLKRLV